MTECKKKNKQPNKQSQRQQELRIRPRRALFTPHLETGELFKTGVEDTERLKRAKFTALEISGVINTRLLQPF